MAWVMPSTGLELLESEKRVCSEANGPIESFTCLSGIC
jgi:hypothetical protein